MRLLGILIGAIVITCAGGCMFAPHHETMYYDLSILPSEYDLDADVYVTTFENNTGGGQKMKIRTDDFRIIEDGFNKWVQPPGELVARHLGSALELSSTSKTLLVSGVVEVFEANMDSGCFVLQGRCKVATVEHSASDNVVFKFCFSEPFGEPGPSNFAAAATKCVAGLRTQLVKVVADIRTAKMDHNNALQK